MPTYASINDNLLNYKQKKVVKTPRIYIELATSSSSSSTTVSTSTINSIDSDELKSSLFLHPLKYSNSRQKHKTGYYKAMKLGGFKNPNADNLIENISTGGRYVESSGGLRSKRIPPPPLPEYCSVSEHPHSKSWFSSTPTTTNKNKNNDNNNNRSPLLISGKLNRHHKNRRAQKFFHKHFGDDSNHKKKEFPFSLTHQQQQQKQQFYFIDQTTSNEDLPRAKTNFNNNETFAIGKITAPPLLLDLQQQQPQDISSDLEVHEISEEYTTPFYTSSRKSNRAARMNQGPQEYHSFMDILLDFCARTSSHGVPFVGTHSFFGRLIWIFITLFAFFAFCIQTYFTLSDYLSYRTIIEMQLKFEPAPFPAATLCNLNSFKFSELRKFEEIEQGFLLWERAISTLEQYSLKDANNNRRKRQVIYQPVFVKCVCNLIDEECVPQRNDLAVNASVCLCFEDARTGDIWPCYARNVWSQKKCYHCSNSNTCDDPDQPPNITTLLTERRKTDCLCQPISHYCLVWNPYEEIRWWNPHNYSVYPATEAPTPSTEVQEAFGLEDLHDKGAITTKTKENLIFLVAAMPRETRQQLSYTLDEFVLRCSFNSKDCDLKRDFQIHIDPEYGNCYTFNFNDSVILKNSRAGPMYGLRLLLNVNQSDYMPTTEAAGVRLVIHEQDQEPFPDTFGYSAPTSFISSFGLKTKVLKRLDSPYGKCSDTFRPENYIYAEHYSPEGCYRNCFQHILIERCGCADPRFPTATAKPCDARNAKERQCLANETSVLGGFHHLTHDCHCVQPCTENVFETAYSAAAWPAINFNIGAECARVLETENFTEEACADYYHKNTAYIEVYYEQLNFESLKETAGYTMVNLFSDLGGNIGLWIGFSLITVLEFVELFCECLTFGCQRCMFKGFKRPKLRQANIFDSHNNKNDRMLDEKNQLRPFSPLKKVSVGEKCQIKPKMAFFNEKNYNVNRNNKSNNYGNNINNNKNNNFDNNTFDNCNGNNNNNYGKKQQQQQSRQQFFEQIDDSTITKTEIVAPIWRSVVSSRRQ